MNRKSTIYTSFFFLLLLLCQTVNSQQSSTQHINIALKWRHQFQFAGYYAAIKNGYYQEEGYNVTLLETSPGQSSVELVLKGEAAFGVSNSDLIVSRSKGAPVAVLAVIFQHSPVVLLSKKAAQLTYLEGYHHKKISGTPTDYNEIRMTFIKEGVNPDSIIFQSSSNPLEDLMNDRVDAIAGYVTSEPYDLTAAGLETRIIYPYNYGIDFYGDALFTTDATIRKDPECVEKMTRATLRGWEYALSHKTEIIDYILTLPNVSKRGITREKLEYEANKMDELIQPKLIEIGHMNPMRWEKMAQMYYDLGLIDNTLSISEFLYTPQTQSHQQKVIFRIITILLISTIIVFFIVLVLNHQLKMQVNKRSAELKKITLRDEALLKAIPDLMFIFDHHCHIIDYKHDSTDKHFISPPEIFLGKKLKDIFPEHINRVIQRNVNQVLTTGLPTIDSYTMEHDGETFYYETRFVPSGKNEVLAMERNITGRKLQEEQIMAANEELEATSEALKENMEELEKAKVKAEESNRLKTHFLANMSHEIRTPMNGIIGFLQILKEMDITKEEQNTYIDLINKSGNRLMNTINDIMEISKIETGHTELSNTSINLNEMLHFFHTFFIPEAQEKNIMLVRDILPGEKMTTFTTDQTKLESILSNIIKNAIKFTNSGKVRFGYYSNRKELIFFVKDTGIGIPKERQEAIFDRFVQANINISRDHEGSGLGLAIAKAYTEKLGGQIRLESIVGEGSSFYVTFPLNRCESDDSIDSNDSTDIYA